VRKFRITNPPARIWLNAGDIEGDADFVELSEVTWCAERMDDADIEYRLVRPRNHQPRDSRRGGFPRGGNTSVLDAEISGYSNSETEAK
jgi:hypothetical protein